MEQRARSFAARKYGSAEELEHPAEVAGLVREAGGDEVAVAAAWLHDVVEDTDRTLDDLRRAFPERVVHLVDLLTKWWADDAPKAIKQTEKPKYYGAILKDQEAMAVKLLDRADNLHDMTRMLPKARDWAERYARKTEQEVAPIYEACDNAKAREAYAEALAGLKAKLDRTPVRPRDGRR